MTEIMTLLSEEVAPARDAVLLNQGIARDQHVNRETEDLCTAALGLLSESAVPVGILAEISKADFGVVYRGEGRNETRTPVEDIFPQAANLALFAVTLGQRVSDEIDERFRSKDFALGLMLDAAASAAADRMTEIAENRFLRLLSGKGQATRATRVLAYCPGYCGWHISGQRKIFEVLQPGQIGISLRDSFLMQPLKSVSGVLIAGPEEIHSFPDSYSCCHACQTRSCRERVGGQPEQ